MICVKTEYFTPQIYNPLKPKMSDIDTWVDQRFDVKIWSSTIIQ